MQTIKPNENLNNAENVTNQIQNLDSISTKNTVPNIVIVGGGAGGLELTTALGRKLGKKGRARITLVDKNRVHIWKPLLHEVATGSLDDEIDGVVYRAHAARHNYNFQYGTLSSIDRGTKTLYIDPILDEKNDVVLEQRQIKYDILVLAIGSISNDFGTEGANEYCHMLDSRAQAQTFQKKLLNLFLQKAENSMSDSNQSVTRLAIVGAGATGVELSAELYHVIDVLSIYDLEKKQEQKLEIDLIEAGPRILPALPERIAQSAAQELEKLGVIIRTNTRVAQVTKTGLIDSEENAIAADLMVWAAGVKAQDWLKSTNLELNQINQIMCHRNLRTITDESIYAIGDCCAVEMPDGSKVPPRAQSAHQMATIVMKNICRTLEQKELLEFTYKDYGSLVNLSRFSTVGSLMGNLVKGSMFIEGKIARLMYLSLYRMHQLSIHGYIKGPFIILLSSISKIIRPKIKLH